MVFIYQNRELNVNQKILQVYFLVSEPLKLGPGLALTLTPLAVFWLDVRVTGAFVYGNYRICICNL